MQGLYRPADKAVLEEETLKPNPTTTSTKPSYQYNDPCAAGQEAEACSQHPRSKRRELVELMELTEVRKTMPTNTKVIELLGSWSNGADRGHGNKKTMPIKLKGHGADL